jgi:polar amino acid transport system ATP-binding protein
MNDVANNPRGGTATVHAAGVDIKDLRKSYGSNEVLKGISLNVKPGEVVCLIGPSGSGKSTLLRCVNLLEQPNQGSIHVGGFEATDPDVDIDKMRRKVGMVFQQFNLFPHLDAKPRRPFPGPALRRPAAAGGHCPRAQHGPGADALRRAHLGA